MRKEDQFSTTFIRNMAQTYSDLSSHIVNKCIINHIINYRCQCFVILPESDLSQTCFEAENICGNVNERKCVLFHKWYLSDLIFLHKISG